jgi:putative transposase
MPRGPRRDAPDVAHHVWQRGIGRMVVYRDDADRGCFLSRFERLLEEQGMRAYGVVLLSNHFHAVLQTGKDPLWKFMHRLTTGYARYFVERHGHSGHVFQNRYGSHVLEDDDELATVVAYAARNPLEAGLVPDEAALRCQYPWSSYPALMGAQAPSYGVAVGATLALFGRSVAEARVELRARVIRGVAWEYEQDAGEAASPALDPERAKRFAAIAEEVCARANLDPRAVRGRSRDSRAFAARAEIARLAARAGFIGREIARELGVSAPTASRLIRAAIERGEE